MKSIYIFLVLFLLSTVGLDAQRVYVDASASGANDGTSWASAYTSLEAALNDMSASEIWVASGTYVPGDGTGDTSSTFLITHQVDLYGGFSGSETSVDQRDFVNNTTTLSGDIMANDDGSFDAALRADNVRHVITVDSMGGKITIDGFFISGGQTSDNGDHDFTNRAGGGILSFSALAVANCSFSGNFGRSGGGIAIDNSGGIQESVEIRSCAFSDNIATSQSAGIVVYSINEVIIDNCRFIDNTTNRGVVYPVECQSVAISNCEFDSNVNPTGFGGALFSWQNFDLSITDCTFRDNRSVQAACMYYDARNTVTLGPSLTIERCSFIGNAATDGFSGAFTLWQGTNIRINECEFTRNSGNSAGCILYNGTETPGQDPNHFIMTDCQFGTNEALTFGGGACYFSGSSFTIRSCNFLGNLASNSGGAVFITGDDKNYLMEDCFLGLNNANYGGAMTHYGENTNGIMRNCDFQTNTAGTGGGSMNVGFKTNLRLESCDIIGGTASVGGGISCQNDSTTVTADGCNFTGNTANNSGGGFFTFTGDVNVNLLNSTFMQNTADFGAAVHLAGAANIDTSYFTISGCTMAENTAVTQGGAINVINKSGVIENTLIYGNFAENVGTGGAISANASDDQNVEISILNSTISNNLGLLVSGIAAWTDSIATNQIVVQNTILDNGNDYAVEDGSPEFISGGGNFSSDVFMSLYLDALLDVLSEDPMFEDPFGGDFHLLEGSPCIDAGNPENAPATDIEGNMRDEMPDIGAYEYGAMVSTDETPIFELLNIHPNPVEDVIQIQLPEYNSKSKVWIFDQLGRLVVNTTFNGQAHKINVASLTNGEYYMFINGEQKFQAKFIKI
ncbi:MAG: T9SS type A sorting domain-containing protein [Saprospiraceae bacterium]|nr:T9SS type A sorting domain-containing protein [Saprospiraceae bacterium]